MWATGFLTAFVLYYKDMSDEPVSSVRLFSYAEDQPNEELGSLIPRSLAIDEIAIQETREGFTFVTVRRVAVATIMPVVGVALLLFVGFSGFDIMTAESNVAAPIVTVYDPNSDSRTTLSYGPQSALANAGFFDETRNAFIEEELSFLEIDLESDIVRFFDKGVLVFSSVIIAAGEPGSWWDSPSGIYKVEDKDEKKFSQYTQTYFPWSITFEGNYAVHAWPVYPNGKSAPEDFAGGGVRLEAADAEKLYELMELGQPVLVREATRQNGDSFVYEPTAPNVTAKHYLVADIENGSILASSDLHEVVPIASLTKLMTAVVAAEKMNLDDRVRVGNPTFVQSLIPRLAERSSVSMYSLMQLLLLESSNEASEVIAGQYGRDDFIKEMNDKARIVGMFDTAFADPSGLSAENVSSLGDLFQLTRYIRTHRDFIFEISATGEAVGVAGGGEFSNISNFNEVQNLNNFVGGKIGETLAAGKTSVSLHEIEVQGSARTVVIILLGSEARNDDVTSLVGFVESRFGR